MKIDLTIEVRKDVTNVIFHTMELSFIWACLVAWWKGGDLVMETPAAPEIKLKDKYSGTAAPPPRVRGMCRLNGKLTDYYYQIYAYDGILQLAGYMPGSVVSITWQKPDGAHGSLRPNETIEMVNGIIIDAMITGNA